MGIPYWLLVLWAPVAATFTLRDIPLVFEKPGTGRRALLTNDDQLLILRRNQSAPPTEFLLILTKHTYLIAPSTYGDPQPDDELSPYTVAFKGGAHPDQFPILLATTPDTFVPPNAAFFGKGLWVINQTFPALPALIESSNVLWWEVFKPINLNSRQARDIHYEPVHTAPPEYALGTDIIIAIADTGIDISHCAFDDPNHDPPTTGQYAPSNHAKIASHITSAPGFTDYRGSDGSHGTASASQAAGAYCGTGEVVGTASGARIAFLDFTPAGSDRAIYLPIVDGPGVTTYYEYLESILTVGQASVVSNSWGSNSDGRYDGITATLDSIAYDYETAWFGFAVGNEAGVISSPGGLGKSIQGIGASFANASNYLTMWPSALTRPDLYAFTQVVDFSSHGPTRDGRRTPLIYAPGVSEWVAFGLYNPISGHYHATRMSGSSFSCPTAAGLAAHIQCVYKAQNGGKLPLASLVTATLIAWTVPMTGTTVWDSERGATGRLAGDQSNWYGYGVVSHLGAGTNIEDKLTSGAGSVKSYCFRAKANLTRLGVGLAWTDVPVAPYVSRVLVNDLDLYVYVKHRLIHESTDWIHSHELARVEGVMAGDTVRVVVEEADGTVAWKYADRPYQSFGVHLSTTEVEPMVEGCGTCHATVSERCDATRVRFCNATTGELTPCLRERNIAAVGPPSDCRGENYNGYHGQDGACIIQVCDGGFYYHEAHGRCECVPGYRSSAHAECDATGLVFFEKLAQEQLTAGASPMASGGLPSLVGLLVLFFSI